MTPAGSDRVRRPQSEPPLQEIEARLRALGDSAPVLLWMSARDGRCIFFNQRWLEFSGRTMDDEIGEGWAELIHPEDDRDSLEQEQRQLKRLHDVTGGLRLPGDAFDSGGSQLRNAEARSDDGNAAADGGAKVVQCALRGDGFLRHRGAGRQQHQREKKKHGVAGLFSTECHV